MPFCIRTVRETGNPLITWVKSGGCQNGEQEFTGFVPPGFSSFLKSSGLPYEVTPQNGGTFYTGLHAWLATVSTQPVTTTLNPAGAANDVGNSVSNTAADIGGQLKKLAKPFTSVTDFLNWVRDKIGNVDTWKGIGLLLLAGLTLTVGLIVLVAGGNKQAITQAVIKR